MKFVSKTIVAFATILISTVSQATVLDHWTTQDAADVHVYQNNSDGSITVNVKQEGAGSAQETRLSIIMWLPTGGYTVYGTPEFKLARWSGIVPNQFVSINGVASAQITVNTCTLDASYTTDNACGPIDLTITKDPLAFGDVGAGAYAYNYNGFIYQYVGTWSRHNSTAVGSVNGIMIDTAANSAFGASRATINRSTKSSVTIVTGP